MVMRWIATLSVSPVQMLKDDKPSREHLDVQAPAAQVLWLDQADAQAVSEGEEVTLMDWGNAIIQVRTCECGLSLACAEMF